MMIAVGSDHGGYALKEAIKEHLTQRGIQFRDFGTIDGSSCDYPDIAKAVANAVVNDAEIERGLLFCGTGIGISMAANKVKGIRAACCSDTFSAKFTRLHNDANILCMGGRVVGVGLAIEMVDAYLDAKFEGDRHQRRVDMITAMENQ